MYAKIRVTVSLIQYI